MSGLEKYLSAPLNLFVCNTTFQAAVALALAETHLLGPRAAFVIFDDNAAVRDMAQSMQEQRYDVVILKGRGQVRETLIHKRGDLVRTDAANRMIYEKWAGKTLTVWGFVDHMPLNQLFYGFLKSHADATFVLLEEGIGTYAQTQRTLLRTLYAAFLNTYYAGLGCRKVFDIGTLPFWRAYGVQQPGHPKFAGKPVFKLNFPELFAAQRPRLASCLAVDRAWFELGDAVIFFTQPFAWRGEHYMAILRKLRGDAQAAGFRFLVKPHPEEDTGTYAGFEVFPQPGMPAELFAVFADPDRTVYVTVSSSVILNLNAPRRYALARLFPQEARRMHDTGLATRFADGGVTLTDDMTSVLAGIS